MHTPTSIVPSRSQRSPLTSVIEANRVLMRNNPAEIRSMVENMFETGRMSRGYMMCVGNHIPWNVSPDAIKRHLDLSAELATR